MKRITIEPVSRIEGHAKITIQLDDQGHVAGTPNFTSRRFAALRNSPRGIPSTRCRASRHASAGSARSAICWPRPRPVTPSWRCVFLRLRKSCASWCTSPKSCNRTR